MKKPYLANQEKGKNNPIVSHNEDLIKSESTILATTMPPAVKVGTGYVAVVVLQQNHIDFLKSKYADFETEYGVILASLAIAQINVLMYRELVAQAHPATCQEQTARPPAGPNALLIPRDAHGDLVEPPAREIGELGQA